MVGDTRLISKGSNIFPIGSEFEGIIPPDGHVLDAVEMTVDSGTYTIAAADLNGIAHTYDSDVTFKCIWKSEQPELATQTITASNVTKTYGNAAFALGAVTDGDGELTYKSSNTKVVVIDSTGKVTIKSAGTAKITINASATETYAAAEKTITVTINKAANPLKVKANTATVKFSNLKKKNQTLKVGKVIAFTKKGQGTVTYVKKSGNKKIAINKTTGKVTVKKGLKKGTYKVKINVTAAGNGNYKKVTKPVTVTIKVK